MIYLMKKKQSELSEILWHEYGAPRNEFERKFRWGTKGF